MIRYYLKDESLGLKEIDHIQSGCWINVSTPYDQEELETLGSLMDIPTDFLMDSLDLDERSRYEKEGDVRYIVLNTPVLNERDNDSEAYFVTVPVGIVLTEGHLITICPVENSVLELFVENRIRNVDPVNQSRFVIHIFMQTVFRFLDYLKRLNLKRTLIEKDLYDSSKNSELKQLLRIEKSLVYFVNSLSTNELLKMKIKRTDFLGVKEDEDAQEMLEDVIIDNSQALEMANIHTNILSGTMQAYSSIVSNNLNVFIHRLTVVTIVLMVPTLIASFYGMNLKNLPLKDHDYAFYYILGISIVLGIVLVFSFRRNKIF